jgi:hypothetical protein
MIRVTANGIVLMLLVSAVGAGELRAPNDMGDSPEALKAEIEALKTANVAWRKIAWTNLCSVAA